MKTDFSMTHELMDLADLPEDKIRELLQLAQKEGRLGDPRVMDAPLKSLFIWRSKADGTSYLDSTEVFDFESPPYPTSCEFCRSPFKPSLNRHRFCDKSCSRESAVMNTSLRALAKKPEDEGLYKSLKEGLENLRQKGSSGKLSTEELKEESRKLLSFRRAMMAKREARRRANS